MLNNYIFVASLHSEREKRIVFATFNSVVKNDPLTYTTNHDIWRQVERTDSRFLKLPSTVLLSQINWYSVFNSWINGIERST